MTLLEALVEMMSEKRAGVTHARLAHFAFADDGDIAFLSEIETQELVPLLEQWCRQQRKENQEETGSIH